MSFTKGTVNLDRAQNIALDVNEDMPDADDIDKFREMKRRINDPSYTPRNTVHGAA